MQRLSDLEHRVVGGVHRRRERAHPGRGEPGLHADRRRRVADPPDDARQVPRASFEVDDLDGGHLVRLLVVLVQSDVRHPKRHARRRRHLPRDPDDREEVRAVRRDLDVEDRIVEAVGLLEVGPRLEVVGDDQDPRVLGRDPELPRGAEHPVGDDAADLPGRQGLGQRGHGGARPGERHEVSRHHVADAHHHLAFRVPGRHPGQAERVGVRVVADLQDPGHHHALQAVPRPLDLLHLRTLGGEELGQLLG